MNGWDAPVALHQPLWLLLLPLAWVSWRVVRDRRGTRLEAFAERALLGRLLRGGAPGRSTPAVPIGWSLLVLALSGPYLPDAPARVEAGIDLALVVDVSPSMSATDVTPDRLARARFELVDLLERHRGRVAVIAYSAHAYQVLPLTHDAALAQGYIEALDTTLTRHSGSNLVQALELAAQSLEPSGDRGRAVLIVGDGEVPDRADTIAAADRIAARGIPVFALGIGTPGGAAVPTSRGYVRGPDGRPVISRLDRDLLATLAARSGGLYADAAPDGADIDRLLAGFAALGQGAATEATPAGYPLHPWLLAAGLALLLWRGVAPARAAALPALVLATLMLTPLPQAQASPWTARAAWDALNEGRYEEAASLYARLEGFDARMGEGAAAWRRADWARALAQFEAAERLARDDDERAAALYNQANALARTQRLREALATFERALALRPDHARALRNRDLVARALERRIAATAAGDRATRADGASPPVVGGDARAPDAGGGSGTGRAASAAREGTTGPEDIVAAGASGASTRLPATRAAAVEDDPREVLRHRFMVLDAARTRLPETHTW